MRCILFYILMITSCASCTQRAAFRTPNDVSKMEATVYMNDGTILKGLLSVYLENDIAEGQINLLPHDSKTEQALKIKDISYYTIGSDTYMPKEVDLYTMGTYHFLFVKRLTAATDKMQLYELHQLYKSNATGEENYYYFFDFPNFSKYEVVELNSSKVLPGFDFKMSRYVEDCPALAKKIRARERAYYYGISSLRSKREEVIKNIVKEYNECK